MPRAHVVLVVATRVIHYDPHESGQALEATRKQYTWILLGIQYVRGYILLGFTASLSPSFVELFRLVDLWLLQSPTTMSFHIVYAFRYQKRYAYLAGAHTTTSSFSLHNWYRLVGLAGCVRSCHTHESPHSERTRFTPSKVCTPNSYTRPIYLACIITLLVRRVFGLRSAGSFSLLRAVPRVSWMNFPNTHRSDAKVSIKVPRSLPLLAGRSDLRYRIYNLGGFHRSWSTTPTLPYFM